MKAMKLKTMNKFVKFISLISILVMCICLLPVHAEGETTIHITNAEELTAFAENCSYDAYSKNMIVELDSDIDLSGTDFSPIPVFLGTFHGNGHVISGFTIDEDTSPCGFFKVIGSTGSIQNLKLRGTVSPSRRENHTGGIAGINYGTITASSFSGTLSGARNTGGIAGVNMGTISQCTAGGTYAGKKETGGIAGYNLGNITNCENNAYVNTAAAETAISLEDVDLNLTGDLDTFVNDNSSIIVMDTGGIAGYSCGYIANCENHGNIGYQSVGYNTGGIAGRNSGHIFNCTNDGTIYGRKDAGGIAGQAEPYIEKELSESTVSTLKTQLDELNGLVNGALNSADGLNASAQGSLNSLQSYLNNAGSALDDIGVDGSISTSITHNVNGTISFEDGIENIRSGTLDAETAINAGTDLSSLTSSINGITGAANSLANSIGSGISSLTSQARQISSKAKEIETTLYDELERLSDLSNIVNDTSAIDIESLVYGKILSCTNEGTVNGDLSTGGIAGSMSLEYEADPEDDTSSSLDVNTKTTLHLKDVILRCTNNGSVIGKRDNTGGIVGRGDLGVISGAQSYGSVTSSGSNTGGIEGLADNEVTACYARLNISAGENTGGIVGVGTAYDLTGGGSNVNNCLAMVTIDSNSRKTGGIAGTEAGTYTSNRFVSSSLGGLGGISYEGEAEPVSYSTLLSEESLPDSFKTLILRFVLDGEVVKEVTFSAGDSFDSSVCPSVPEKEGMRAVYDVNDLSNLTEDTTVTITYEPSIKSIASDEKRSDGRSVFYVSGSFEDEDTVSLEFEQNEETPFHVLSSGVWDALTHYITHPGKGIACTEIEQWQMSISGDESTHEVRYLAPSYIKNLVRIFVKEGNGWEEVNTETVGSYLTFDVNTNEPEIAAVMAVPGWWVFAVLAALGVLIFVLVRIHQVNKKAVSYLKKRSWSKKQKLMVGAIAAVLACMIGAGIHYSTTTIRSGIRAYQLIESMSGSYTADVSLTTGSTTVEGSYEIAVMEDKILKITKDGLTFYYKEGKIVLENGRTFDAGGLIPDFEGLLEKTREIYEDTTLSAESSDSSNTYTIRSTAEDAKDLLSLMSPSLASLFDDMEQVEVSLVEKNSSLSEMKFSSSGVLTDDDHTTFDIEASVRPKDSEVDTSVSTTVKKAFESGSEDTVVLTKEYLDLLYAWADFESSDSAAAKMHVTLSGGPFSISDDLQVYRLTKEGVRASALQKDDLILYFNEDEVLDEYGNSLTDSASLKLVESGRMMHLLYEISEEGSFDLSAAGDNEIFTMDLSSDAMKTILERMNLDLEGNILNLTSGTLEVTVNSRKISRVRVEIDGSVTVLEASVPVSLKDDITLSENTSFTIPDSVFEKLDNEE